MTPKRVCANTLMRCNPSRAVTMTLLLYDKIESPVAPLMFSDIRVAQGQTLDLGRLELGPGVVVAVKVVDSAGGRLLRFAANEPVKMLILGDLGVGKTHAVNHICWWLNANASDFPGKSSTKSLALALWSSC